MLNFCIKSVHSFLAFTTTKDNINSGTALVLDQQQFHNNKNIPLSPGPTGLSFITFSDNNTHNPTNVVDSAAIKPPPPPPPAAVPKLGFLDEVEGSVSGLMSCTESLGFESSDERRDVDDQVMVRIISEEERGLRAEAQMKRRRRRRGRREGEVRKFPPPLSSLNRDGTPCFFLRPVRRDGRLELTGVRIDRVEVLHASRQDGRLRLDMVVEEDIEEEETVGNGMDNNNLIEEEKLGVDDIEEEMDEGKNITIEQEIIEEEKIGDGIKKEVEGGKIEDIDLKEEEEEEEEEEGGSGKWVFGGLVVGGGGDGFRRCHEVGSHHHHHHNLHGHHYLHAWGQHCVTIR